MIRTIMLNELANEKELKNPPQIHFQANKKKTIKQS